LKGSSFRHDLIYSFRNFLDGIEDRVEKPKDSNKAPQEFKKSLLLETDLSVTAVYDMVQLLKGGKIVLYFYVKRKYVY
jgi:hypothetical protein